MNDTKYHCYQSCNSCSGTNSIKVIDSINGVLLCEAETICDKCGHKDYWAYGFFESMSDIESKCKTYSF